MTRLIWTNAFVRAFRKTVRQRPEMRGRVERTLQTLTEEPFHQSLRTHKLKGELAGAWACSAAYDCRIVFQFVRPADSVEEEILLLDIGTHDEVY